MSKSYDASGNLPASPAFSEQVINASPNLIYVYDLVKRSYIYVNPRVSQVLGYSSQQFLEMGASLFSTLIHPDDLNIAADNQSRLATALDGDIIESEYRMRHANGNWRWLLAQETIFSRTETGAPHQVVGVIQDITARKQAEQDLHESEARYRRLVDLSPDSIAVVSEGRYVFANPAAAELLGAPNTEALMGKPVLETIHPDDRASIQERLENLGEGKANPPLEIRLLGLNGQITEVESRSIPIIYKGAPAGLLIGHSLTRRRQVEQALKESEERFRRLAENAPDMIYRYRLYPLPGFDYVNPAIQGFTGYSPEEYYADPELILSVIHPDDRVVLDNLPQQVGPTGRAFTVRLLHRLGAIIWTDHHVVPIYNTAGQIVAVEGIARDMTASKKAEEREKLAYELGQQWVRVLDPDKLLAISVERLRQTFGYYHAHVYLYEESIDASAKPGRQGRLVVYAGTGPVGDELKRRRHSIPLDATKSLVARAARQLKPVIANNVHENSTFMPNPLLPDTRSEAAIPLFSADHLIGVLDVQHRAPCHFSPDEVRALEIVASELSVALTNARLFADNSRRLAIIENSSDLIALFNPQLLITYINPAGARLLGYDRPDEIIGRSVDEFHSAEHFKLVKEQAVPAALDQGIWRGENYLRQRDGRLTSTEQTILAIRDRQSNLQTLATIMTDISERKRAEQALRQSEAKYRELADNIDDIFFGLDTELRYTYWNKASEELTGISAQQALGKPLWEIFPETRGSPLENIYRQAIRDRQPQELTSQITLAGKEYFFELNVYPGERGLSIFARDITERIKAEHVLQQRNRALGLLNRAGQVFISTLDLDQVLAAILEEVRTVLAVIACSAWLIDPTTGELVCRQVTDPQGEQVHGWRLQPGQGLAGWAATTGQSLIVADAQSDPRHFRAIDQQTGLTLRSILTVPLKARDRIIGVLQVVDKEVDRFTLTDLGVLESLAATATIAIENARLYEQAREDAETKSALLAEVNHRVKNNLAVIIGLLYAEQRHSGMENQEVHQAILSDLISRVQGLATVHSMLSASGWTPLRLSELAYQVIRSAVQALPRHQFVSIAISPSVVLVTPEQAHQLALIINELTTNTLQHVLTRERSSVQISVRISQEDRTINCEFRDDGPGYPGRMLEPSIAYSNVGFELIRNIVQKSLRGELKVYNDRGAVTVIRFKQQT